jgi:hypothetical protein
LGVKVEGEVVVLKRGEREEEGEEVEEEEEVQWTLWHITKLLQ